MDTERMLQKNVLDELDWDPRVDAARIGVAVHEGVVTLTGHVPSYDGRMRAEKAARRVLGVQAIANELVVDLPAAHRRDDTDIARSAVQTLRWSVTVPDNAIDVTVRNAWITLEGEVEWNYQRVAAEKALRRLTGVRGVTNLIRIRPHVAPTDVKDRIEKALRRAAEHDAKHITVDVTGGKVVLAGAVRSWAERDDAEAAAWAAPGVFEVRNDIRIEPHPALVGI